MNLTKLEYLKLAVTDIKPLLKKSWYYTAIAIPDLKDVELTEEHEELDLVTKSDGIYYLKKDELGKLIPYKITDYLSGKPLYSWKDEIVVDSSWMSSISGKTDTNIGRLCINLVCLYQVVGAKVPYFNKPGFGVRALESHIVSHVRDASRNPDGVLSVKDMLDCINNIDFFTFASSFTTTAATPKTISPAPGAKEFRNSLLKEYGDRIKDPVIEAEYLDRLAQYDHEYLSGDPFYEAMKGNKVRASRAKTYYSFGRGLDFVENKDGLIKGSLYEGIEPKPEEVAKHNNDLRFASFSRGSKTALGGYFYKLLQRALSTCKIVSTPCDTTKGLMTIVDGNMLKELVGRYIKVGAKWELINSPEDAKKYEGKVVELRSTMFCTAKESNYCYACMSEYYKGQTNAITNIASNLSSVVLTAFLKLMHGTVTDSIKIDKIDLLR